MAFGAPSLKGCALRWLAQREHSRAELKRKLARHAGCAAAKAAAASDEPPDAEALQARVESVLDELAAAGWLSEARVAESVLHAKAARWGSWRLKQTLQARGLAPSLIAQALQAASATEFERALALCRRRFGDTPPADAADRARRMRFLAARGFESDVAGRAVREATQTEGRADADALARPGPEAPAVTPGRRRRM